MTSINAELFHKLAMEGNQPILVEFWAPWCVYCRRIAPAMNQLSQQYASKLTIGQVNIDDEPALAEKEKISVVPTLVLYENGERLGAITAPDSKAQIEDFILDTLGE